MKNNTNTKWFFEDGMCNHCEYKKFCTMNDGAHTIECETFKIDPELLKAHAVKLKENKK